MSPAERDINVAVIMDSNETPPPSITDNHPGWHRSDMRDDQRKNSLGFRPRRFCGDPFPPENVSLSFAFHLENFELPTCRRQNFSQHRVTAARLTPRRNDSAAPVEDEGLAVCGPGDPVHHQSIALRKHQRFYYLQGSVSIPRHSD